ncbi:hypothetical protein M6G65_33150 (plasmid) [Methylobacterium tardum]|uniref:hypothetical protein n=1 Tax=Methylobacterium tardum TaxID=374432 RepID=UPI002022329B|nr:hypothetical protein [Methylobacterium tardum]URD40297.1 hypothetical protein M6G65_33150 [Methylobacterium tardum]
MAETFDPAEFEAFKTQAAPASMPPTSELPTGWFDPAEFEAFKAGAPVVQAAPAGRRDGAASLADRIAGDHSAPQRFASQTGEDTALGRGLRAKADEEVIGKPSAENDAIAGLIGAGQAASLNLAGNAAAGAATVLGKMGVSGYGDGSRTFGENYQRFADLRDAHARQSPKSTIAGTVAGAIASAPLLPELAGAPAASGLARAGQYAATGGLYGAAAEAIDTKDPLKAGIAGGVGALAGGTLGPAIERLAPVVVSTASRALEPLASRLGYGAIKTADGFSPEAVAALRDAGLDPSALPPELIGHIQSTFTAKGVSPGAVREAQAAEFGIPLSRGQATGDAAAMAVEQGAAAGANGQKAQAAAQAFDARQADAVAAARDRLAGTIAGSFPRIENPQVAGEAVADAARRIGDDAMLRGGAAQQRADQALEAVRGSGLPSDTLDAAGLASQGIRDAAGQAKAAYRQGYDEVAAIPGTFAPGALDRMGTRVRDRLGAEVPIGDVLTPSATRAISDLDQLPGIFGLAPGEGPNLQQVDQLRKRLVAYRGSTGQNATDRRAMDQILGHFGDHLHDAMDAGLFGQQAPAQAAGQAADGFRGMAATPDAAATLPAAGGAPTGKSEPLTHYLARNGGIALGDDARAADLGRVMTPFGPLGRRNGRPIEDFRDQLASEGFLRPDSADGMISRRIGDEVHDLIGLERSGQPVYRLADLSRGGAPADVGGRIADQSAAYAERLAPFRQQVADDLVEVGYHPRDIDPTHLGDAAQRLFRGEHDTGADAYEAAVMGHAPVEAPNPRVSAVPESAPFEAGAAPASGGFPLGDTGPSDAMRRARGLFRDYRQAFAPRGPGDVAGRNLQRIVEQEASPNEVASMLFGGPSGRVTGRQLETLDRIKSTVGEDSPAWQAVQQATMGKYLEGRDVGRSLDYLLRGEGRDLASRVLTAEQRRGLETFRTGIRQAEDARASVPGWVQDVARSGYDPNRVLGDLFGSGIPGARPGQAAYGRGLKQYLGADSPEWANLRQAAWLRLVQHGEATPALSPRREADRIRSFINGEGKGLAETLFSQGERGMMRRYADVLALTESPRGKRMPDGGRAAKIANNVLNVVLAAAGAKIGGPVGALAAYGARAGQQAARTNLAGARAARSFEGGAPRAATTLPAYAFPAGQAAGLAGGLLGSALVPRGR